MLIQCTKKLLDQLKIKSEPQKEEDALFSWHANLITVNRRKAVVLVNDKNRYVIVLYGLQAKDFKKLGELIFLGIREALKAEGIKDEVIEKYMSHSNEIAYTKTKDRTSVSRLNKACENLYYFDDYLEVDSVVQNSLSMRLSRLLVGVGKKDYIDPNEEMYKDLEVFSGESIFSTKAVEMKVTLNLENHHVWRNLIVPANYKFDKLHKVLQEAFGWKDYHLHEFYIYDKKESDKQSVKLVAHEEAFAYKSDIPMELNNRATLLDYIPARIKYIYDFGDSWEHYIEVENVINDYDKNYPICLDGAGNTPPEDVGGELGFEEFLKIIADETHPDHNHTFRWGISQGYADFDIKNVNRMLKNI